MFRFVLLLLLATALASQLELKSNTPYKGTFDGVKPHYFYIDAYAYEEVSIWVDSVDPAAIHVALDPYPAAFNASWTGFGHLVIPEVSWGWGRLYIAIIPPTVYHNPQDAAFTLTGVSAVLVHPHRPFTYEATVERPVNLEIPVCKPGATLSIKFDCADAKLTKVFRSQLYGRPRTSDPSVDLTGKDTFTFEVKTDKFSPLFLAIHASTKTKFTITVSTDDLTIVNSFELYSGHVITDCYAYFSIEADPTSALPITAISKDDWFLEETAFYISYSEENKYPDAKHYDDVAFLEEGGIVSLSTIHLEGTHMYVALAPTIHHPRVEQKYELFFSDNYQVVIPGSKTIVSVPPKNPSYIAAASELQHNSIGIAVEMLVPNSRAEDFEMRLSYDNPRPDSNDKLAENGVAFIERFGFHQDMSHFYISIKSLKNEFTPEFLPIIAQFIYKMDMDKGYTVSIEEQEFKFFRLTIPRDQSFSNLHITASSAYTSRVDLFADLDRPLPFSLSFTHQFRSESVNSRTKELVIDFDRLIGLDHVFLGVRGLAETTTTLRAWTERVEPLPSHHRFRGFSYPSTRARYFYAPTGSYCIGAQLIVAFEADHELPLSLYMSSYYSNPSEENNDFVIKPGRTLITTAEDIAGYSGEETSWFFTVQNDGEWSMDFRPDPF
ncbi:hypothetical protein RCL1_008145 [Eukaryota sp. TZLM3-RCL]